MRRLLLILCVTVALWQCGTLSALASESALTASPAILESVLNVSLPTRTTVTIQNNTNFPLPIKGSVSAFLVNEPIAPEANLELYNASTWFSLEPADFILQPKEVKNVTVTISPPPTAEPGGHYATIFFHPLIPKDALSKSTTISLARVGILTFLIMPGDMIESLVQSNLVTPAWTAFGPIDFFAELTNNGTVHVQAQSTLTLSSPFGRQLASLDSPPSIILPGTHKTTPFTWEKRLGLGPYQAVFTTTYGTDQVILVSESQTFWIIPWPLILLLLGILTFIYKIFIVNHRRLALAISVLRGTYDPPPEKIT